MLTQPLQACFAFLAGVLGIALLMSLHCVTAGGGQARGCGCGARRRGRGAEGEAQEPDGRAAALQDGAHLRHGIKHCLLTRASLKMDFLSRPRLLPGAWAQALDSWKRLYSNTPAAKFNEICINGLWNGADVPNSPTNEHFVGFDPEVLVCALHHCAVSRLFQ